MSMNGQVPNQEQGKVLQQEACNGIANPKVVEKTSTGVITEQPLDTFSTLGPPPPYTVDPPPYTEHFQSNGFDMPVGDSAAVNNIQYSSDREHQLEEERQRRRRNDEWWWCCYYSEPNGLAYATGDAVATGVRSSTHPSYCCCGHRNNCECCYCWPDCGCCDCGTCDCGDCDCGDCCSGDCGDCGDCNCGDCGNCGDCLVM